MSLLRIWNLVWKELIQLRRNWLMTAFIFTLPVLQLVLLARASSRGISDVGVAVVDFDRSSASRRLIAALDHREELRVTHFPQSLAECTRLLDEGEVLLGVIVPAGFSSDSAAGQEAVVEILADGTNAVSASVALAAAQAALATFGRESHSVIASSPLEIRTHVLYNAGLDVRPFTIPAQVGFIVYQVTLVVAAVGLVRERELGTLEQLIVSPLTRMEIVIGKAVPALIIGMLNFAAMLAVAIFVFGVPMRGSLGLLAVLTMVFVIAEIGYGMLISATARSQQQAILTVFVMAMLDMAFSGYLVRVRSWPVILRSIAQVVPFRHYLTIIRGIMLKGAGLDALWPHVFALAGLAVFVNTVAVFTLSRRLD